EFDHTDQAETTLRREHDDAATRLEAKTVELNAHEAAVNTLSERAEAAQQTWFRLSALAERVSATVRIASERAQHLDTEPDASGGPDPDALDAQAEEVAAQERKPPAAKACPGWPGRWTPCAPASSRSTRPWRACRSASTRPLPAPSRRRRS